MERRGEKGKECKGKSNRMREELRHRLPTWATDD
jgi:hypothetical protein